MKLKSFKSERTINIKRNPLRTEMSSAKFDLASLKGTEGEDETKSTGCIRKMYAAAGAVLLFAVAMGMACGYSATATVDMKKPNSPVAVDGNDISWIGSLVALGAMCGGMISGFISTKFGRKGALILGAAPFFCGWMFIAYASNVMCVFIGRFVTGVCVGLVCVTTPVYLVEISTPEVRGLLGACFQLFVVIGVLLVSAFGTFLHWGWLAATSSICIIVALIVIVFMPESPRWLVANGQFQPAINAFVFLHGPNFDGGTECMSINQDLSQQPKGKITFKELWHPAVFKPFILSVGLLFFQQACGSNAVLFYTVSIFEESGSSIGANESTIIVDVVLVIATVISSVLMDKTGRKILLLVSGIGMGVSLGVLGWFEYAKISHPKLESSYGWIPLACIIIYIATFSFGFGPIPWLMMAEMSPIRYRGVIGGVATSFCWLFVFTVTKTFDGLRAVANSYGVFWLYAAFSILGCVFSCLFLPETKGKTTEEIKQCFVRGVPANDEC